LHATAAQVERIAAGCRRATSLDEQAARQARRLLNYQWDEDGCLVIRGRLSPEEGALVIAALEAARDAPEAASGRQQPAGDSAESPQRCGDPGDDVGDERGGGGDERGDGSAGWADDSAESPHTRGAAGGRSNADALLVLAETLLAHGPAPAPGGERHQVVVHVDLATLTRGHDGGEEDGEEGGPGEPGRRCHLDDGPALHPETVRRIGCDAALLAMVHGRDGTLLDVGRRTRAIPPGLRRALRERDGGCRFPSCTQRRWVDGHHIRHWAHGGETNLSNLIMLCRVHHRLVHEHGFTIAQPYPGAFTFRRPDGREVPQTPDPTPGDPDLRVRHPATIGPHTIVPDWAGDRLDLGLTVFGLLAAEAHAQQRSVAS
jgi:hypothetical protein